MTEAAQPRTAHEIKRCAAAWVVARRASENWSAEDQQYLDAWLGESLEQSIAYWRMDAAWESTNRLSALRLPRHESTPRHNFVSRATKAVAALVGIAVLALAARLALAPEQKTYAAALGDRKILTLGDGSRIELNSNTVLRVAQNNGGRKVWLDKGEAYFEIKHDVARPFVVTIGRHRVTDLGTKFFIRESGERVEIDLLEGRARLDESGTKNKTRSAILIPGDVAVATSNSLSVKMVSNRNLENELAWRTGLLVFRNTTLAEAAVAFNRYNRQKLIIDNQQVAQLTIDGTFHTNNLMAFVDVVQHVLKLNDLGALALAPA